MCLYFWGRARKNIWFKIVGFGRGDPDPLLRKKNLMLKTSDKFTYMKIPDCKSLHPCMFDPPAKKPRGAKSREVRPGNLSNKQKCFDCQGELNVVDNFRERE